MLLPLTLATAVAIGGAVANDFDWNTIEPDFELRYQPCYDDLKCARLKVPLDWLNITNPKTVAIAIATLPATVPEHDASFGGTVVLNPGGPGGSGVKWIRAMGRHIQGLLDRNKHYEILSFDPRGVMYTTPRVDCFSGDIFARAAFALQSRGVGGLDGGDDILKRRLSLMHSFGTLCAEMDVDADILGYVSTASVARDMVEIIDRVDEQRKKSVVPVTAHTGDQQPIVIDQPASSEPARLQFYGISYGTFIGNTFASMFPGRVGRMIIDGVANSTDYLRGDWLNPLSDTEKVMDSFYEECFNAGNRCALRKPEDDDIKSIRKRVDSLIKAAEKDPLQFIHGREIELIDANDIRRVIMMPLYMPIPGYEALATVLADAIAGNYSHLWDPTEIPNLRDSCKPKGAMEPFPVQDAILAIACGDAADTRGKSLSEYTEIVERMKSISATYGEYFSNIAIGCSNWQVRPKWRFEGPFTSPPPTEPNASHLEKGRPAAPLLILSSRLDPATPLKNAYAASNGHPGSSVVIQDSVSHCTLLAGTSEPLAEIMRDYMEYGVVPKNGTVCPADENCKPWHSDGCKLGNLGIVSNLLISLA